MVQLTSAGRISTHDLTKRSKEGAAMGNVYRNFNSRPHEEVEYTDEMLSVIFNISTHDLTKRSMIPAAIIPHTVIFQLTTSRRGRRPLAVPHSDEIISTHDLTKRSRRPRLLPFSDQYFNSRPHEEVDVKSRNREKKKRFQLTTSRRGRGAGADVRLIG